jgi:hypothetical protein
MYWVYSTIPWATDGFDGEESYTLPQFRDAIAQSGIANYVSGLGSIQLVGVFVVIAMIVAGTGVFVWRTRERKALAVTAASAGIGLILEMAVYSATQKADVNSMNVFGSAPTALALVLLVTIITSVVLYRQLESGSGRSTPEPRTVAAVGSPRGADAAVARPVDSRTAGEELQRTAIMLFVASALILVGFGTSLYAADRSSTRFTFGSYPKTGFDFAQIEARTSPWYAEVERTTTLPGLSLAYLVPLGGAALLLVGGALLYTRSGRWARFAFVAGGVVLLGLIGSWAVFFQIFKDNADYIPGVGSWACAAGAVLACAVTWSDTRELREGISGRAKSLTTMDPADRIDGLQSVVRIALMPMLLSVSASTVLMVAVDSIYWDNAWTTFSILIVASWALVPAFAALLLALGSLIAVRRRVLLVGGAILASGTMFFIVSAFSDTHLGAASYFLERSPAWLASLTVAAFLGWRLGEHPEEISRLRAYALAVLASAYAAELGVRLWWWGSYYSALPLNAALLVIPLWLPALLLAWNLSGRFLAASDSQTHPAVLS